MVDRSGSRFLLALATLLVLAACNDGDSEKKSRGFEYMPEMYNTPAYKSQQAMEFTIDGGKIQVQAPAMLTPPTGTVSRDFAAYDIAPTDLAAARALINPLAGDSRVLHEGQREFMTFCAVCHGLDGNSANGFVAATKSHPDRFNAIPSINGSNIAAMSDGEIYHIVSLGRARMPNYRAQLPSHMRWAVVSYLRALDRATLARSDADATLSKLESEMAEGGKRAKDPYAKADLDKARAVVEQRKLDLILIKQGGDGSDFAPPPAPVPEYVKPQFPE
jgi:mono/diheme cytochrome c family protein